MVVRQPTTHGSVDAEVNSLEEEPAEFLFVIYASAP